MSTNPPLLTLSIQLRCHSFVALPVTDPAWSPPANETHSYRLQRYCVEYRARQTQKLIASRGSTYMALAFLVRGSASIADVNRSLKEQKCVNVFRTWLIQLPRNGRHTAGNIGQLRKKLKLLPFNEDAFKLLGLHSYASVPHPASSRPAAVQQWEDRPVQSRSSRTSVFGASFGKHLCGAPDVQSHSLLPSTRKSACNHGPMRLAAVSC